MNIELTQKHIFDIMCHFDQFCRENDLKYFLLGGTLLGAVRHKGFIPWDDDADVGMPREDFERFKKLFNDKLSSFELVDFDISDQSVRPFARLYNKNVKVTFEAVDSFSEYLWLDVFPLDGTFNNKRLNAAHIFLMTRLKGVLYMRHGRYSADLHWLNRAVKTLVRWCTFFMPKSWPCGLMRRVATLKTYEKSEMVGNLYGRWGAGEIVPKPVFGKGAQYEFNGELFWGPENADAYLTSVYGDYMTLPKKENQVSDHRVISIEIKSSESTGRI
ncbi:MAG: LicD family protein [Natronospirillum sp.]